MRNGQVGERPFSIAIDAIVEAHLGHVESARAKIEQGMRMAEGIGVEPATLELLATRGFLELSLADAAAAESTLDAVAERAAATRVPRARPLPLPRRPHRGQDRARPPRGGRTAGRRPGAARREAPASLAAGDRRALPGHALLGPRRAGGGVRRALGGTRAARARRRAVRARAHAARAGHRSAARAPEAPGARVAGGRARDLPDARAQCSGPNAPGASSRASEAGRARRD